MHQGLDPETADLTIISDSMGAFPHTGEKRGTEEYPCWSAEALLSMLPKYIYAEGMSSDEDVTGEDWDYALDIDKEDSEDVWHIGYRHNFEKTQKLYAILSSGGLISVLFSVTEWLLMNKRHDRQVTTIA
jgi:hypothetical protein